MLPRESGFVVLRAPQRCNRRPFAAHELLVGIAPDNDKAMAHLRVNDDRRPSTPIKSSASFMLRAIRRRVIFSANHEATCGARVNQDRR
jgi:hypothetical protein